MMRRALGMAACLSLFLFACSSPDSTKNDNGSVAKNKNEPVDVGAIDPTRDEALTVHIETSPLEIAPGADSMTCEYLKPLDRDLVVTGFGAKQARGGHHMVLFRSIAPKDPGTVADCTSADSMVNLLPALINMTAPEPGSIKMDFPDGTAVILPKGMQLVVQSHYINTTEMPISAQDKMDVWLSARDVSELTLLHLFIVTATNFSIPPLTPSYTAKAGCTLQDDIQAMALGAHMHEWGKAISLDAGPSANLHRVVEVTDWQPEMRNVAPIINFVGDDQSMAAGLFKKGEDAEVTCTWSNSDSYEVGFPNEMCAYSGYYMSKDPAAPDVFCTDPR